MSEQIVISQAQRIIEKFGGVMKLAKALKKVGCPKTPSVIHRWTYGRDKGGTGGVIPSAALFDVVTAARDLGIVLTSEDLDIRPTIKVLKEVKRRN